MPRVALLFVMIVVHGVMLYCQQPTFKNYSLQDGMVSNNVRSIYQDSKGFMWIGTWEGVSQYNGYRFTNYSTLNGLSHNMVNDFMETDGKILISLHDGSIDCIQNDKITRFARLSQSSPHVIRISNNQYLLPTDGDGIHEFRNGKLVKPQQEGSRLIFSRLLPLNDSIILGVILGVRDRLILFGKNYQILSTHFIDHEVPRYLYRDSNQRIWYCTEMGLRLINVNTDQLTCEIVPFPSGFFPSWIANTPVFFCKRR